MKQNKPETLFFLAQIEEESPEQKKIAFLVEKKRLKEALFATLEMHFFVSPDSYRDETKSWK